MAVDVIEDLRIMYVSQSFIDCHSNCHVKISNSFKTGMRNRPYDCKIIRFITVRTGALEPDERHFTSLHTCDVVSLMGEKEPFLCTRRTYIPSINFILNVEF